MAQVLPGPAARAGAATGCPTRAELEHCRPWTDAALRLLDPPLVVPVGRLAIAEWLASGAAGRARRAALQVDGRTVVPLPHPSGASAWANAPANRDLIAVAVGHIAALIRHPA